MDGCQQLTRLIVHGVGDAFGFLLEPLIQPGQRNVGLAKRTVSHFKRRHALDEALTGFSDGFRPVFRRLQRTQERRHSSMVDLDHVQDTQLLGQGTAAQLVCLLQFSFAASLQIALQDAEVLRFHLIQDAFHRNRW